MFTETKITHYIQTDGLAYWYVGTWFDRNEQLVISFAGNTCTGIYAIALTKPATTKQKLHVKNYTSNGQRGKSCWWSRSYPIFTYKTRISRATLVGLN